MTYWEQRAVTEKLVKRRTDRAQKALDRQRELMEYEARAIRIAAVKGDEIARLYRQRNIFSTNAFGHPQ